MLSCVVLPILLALVMIVTSPLHPQQSRTKTSVTDTRLFFTAAAAASAAASVGAAALVYQDLGSYRYLTPLVWWPVILSAALIAPWLTRVPAIVVSAFVAIPLAVFATAAPLDDRSTPSLMTYRDPLTTCLLQLKTSAGLKTGIAGYWLARYVTALSDWQIQIDQVKDDGVAYYWENDPRWYSRDFDDPRRDTPYNFIVVVVPRDSVNPDGRATIMPDEARALYGVPDKILSCPVDVGASPSAPHAEIWVYNDPRHIRTVLDANSCDLYPGTHRRKTGNLATPACIK